MSISFFLGSLRFSLGAGAPSIITPFAADQPAWAERVVKLGVGPRVPGIKRLTAEALAEAIQFALNDTALRARAAALGEKTSAEDGIGRAIADEFRQRIGVRS